MNIAQQGIIILLKSAVTGQQLELPEGFALDEEETKRIVKRHHLIPLVYVGAIQCGISRTLPVMQSLFNAYCKLMIRSEKQMAMVQTVCDAFDAHGIDYLPTKGCNMKVLYPKPELRQMGDADITIRREQCPQIAKVMKELGFELEVDTNDVVVWDHPHLHLELHKRMLCFYKPDYYEDVWSRVENLQGNRYGFSTEDAFVHVFNHFAKHYRVGGIGLRHIMDLYVYRRTFPQMDEAYICQELAVLRLEKFYHNVCRLLEVWFEDGVFDEVTEHLAQVIFTNGSWGSAESHIMADEVKHANEEGKVSNVRIKSIIRGIFPSRKTLQNRYQFLERAPYLLPAVWVKRGIEVLLYRRKNISRKLNIWKNLNDTGVSAYQAQLRLVGLDIEEENGI